MGIKIVDVKFQPESTKRSDFDWVSVLLIFVALGIIIGTIFFVFQFKKSEVVEQLQSGLPLSLVLIENDGKKTESIHLVFFNPKIKKLAFIVVQDRTRLKIDYEDKPAYDIIRNVYSRGGSAVVIKTIEKLTDSNFDYYISYDLKDIEKLVDLLEGIEINNQNSLNYIDTENRIFIKVPRGRLKLDGAKTREVLLFKYGQEGDKIMIDNHKMVTESLLERAEEIEQLFLNSRVSRRILRSIDTNLDRREIVALIHEMRNVISPNILFYKMFGREIAINNENFITPVEGGKWLQDRIKEVKKFINDEGPEPIGDEVKIEILNGSSNPGQAQSLRNHLVLYGLNVVYFGNALRNDYEKTIVIDRIGKPSLAKMIADVINCKEVYTRIDKTLMVDVTIIIGNDFEGKYVR